jgi:hypothetical protein
MLFYVTLFETRRKLGDMLALDVLFAAPQPT